MFRALAPVAALLLSVVFLLMGNGLQTTLAPVRADVEGFSAMSLGLLGGGYYAGFGAGCLIGPLLLRRAGHIRVFAALVAVASAAALIHPIFIDPYIWIGLRAVSGFCLAGLFMVIESWLNEKATNESRGVVFSTYLTINLTVVTIGQMLLLVDDVKAFSLFALTSILLSLAAVPLALTRSAQPTPPDLVSVRLWRLFKLSPVGVIGVAAVGLSNGAFWSLGPVFAQAAGGGPAAAATFMATGAVAGAVCQWPLGRASDKTDRRNIIVFACVGAIVAGAFAFVAGSQSDGLRLSVAALFGGFALPMYALCAAHMNDMIEGDGFVEAAGGLLLTFAVGAMIGPVAASAVMSLLGPDGLFAFTAGIHTALLIFVVIRIRLRRTRPADLEDRTTFADSAVQAKTVAQFDLLDGHAEPEEIDENGLFQAVRPD